MSDSEPELSAIQIIQQKKIVIFGTGQGGRRAHTLLKRENDIIFFIDNDHDKKESTFLGKPVFPPKKLIEHEFEYVYIASASWFLPMYIQLCKSQRIPYEKIIILDGSLLNHDIGLPIFKRIWLWLSITLG